MANEDGAVKIKVNLDIKDVGAGVKDIGSQLENVDAAVGKAGEALRSALANAVDKTTGRRIQDQIYSLGAKLSALGPTYQKAMQGNSAAAATFQAKTADIAESVSRLWNGLQQLGEAQYSTPELDAMDVNIADAEQKALELQETFHSMQDAGSTIKNDAKFKQVAQEYLQALNYLRALQDQRDELIKSGKGIVSFKDSADFQGMATSLDTVTDRLTGMQEHLVEAAINASAARREVEAQVAAEAAAQEEAARQAEAAEEEAAQQAAAAEAARLEEIAQSAQVSSQAVIRLTEELEQLRARQQELNAAGVGMGYAEYDANAERIRAATAALREYEATGSDAQARALVTDETVWDRVRAKILSAAKALRSLTAQAGATGLKKLGTTLSGVGRSAAGAVKSGLSRMVSGLRGLGSRAASVNTGLDRMVKSIRNIGVVSLGLSICKSLFGQLRSVVSDCVSSNNAMSGAVDRLKNGLSNALAPAISVVINLLQKIMPYIIGVADAFASLLTNLFGKGWTTVSTGLGNVADAAGAAAGGIGDASDAAKDAKKNLSGLDELNTWQDKDTSSSGGGGGGGGSETTAPDSEGLIGMLPQWLQDLTGTIRELFEAEDFSGIGELLAGKFGEVVDYLDRALTDSAFQEKIHNALSGFTEGINGFLAGLTFGDGNSVATRFGDFIGDALVLGINSVHTVLAGLNWSSLGVSIGQFVNGGIESLKNNPINLGTILADMLNAAIKTMGGLFSTVNWAQIGSYAASNVNSAFSNVDWSGAGKTVSDGIIGALKSISTFLQEVDWSGIAQNARTFVTSIDWSGIADGIFEGIGSALGGIGAFIWECLKGAFTSIGDYFGNEIAEAGGNVGLGILNGIAGVFVNLWNWVKEHIFQPLINGFKKAFGISSPASNPELVEASGYVGEGILNSIAAVFSNVKEWVKEHILEPIKNGLKAAGDFVINVAVGLVKKVGEWAGEAWDLIKDGAKSIQHTVSTVLSKAGTWVAEAWDAVKDGAKTVAHKVTTALSHASAWVADAWDVVKDGAKTVAHKVTTALSHASAWAADAWDAVKSGAKTVAHKVTTALSHASAWAADAWDAVKSGAKTVSHKVTTTLSHASAWAADAWDAVKDGAKTVSHKVTTTLSHASAWAADAWDAVKSGAKTVAHKVTTALSKASTWVADAWTALTSNSKTTTISTALKKASTWVANAWTALTSKGKTTTVSTALKKAGTWIASAWTALTSKAKTVTISTALKKASTWVADAWTAVSSGVKKTITVTVSLLKSGWSAFREWLGFSKGGIYVNGQWQPIEGYASGGNPRRARLFYANENGMPELVGQIGGHTAVMNNGQIVASVAAGVYQAVAAAASQVGGWFRSMSVELGNIPPALEMLTAMPAQIPRPVMASGTVLPPKAVYATEGESELRQAVRELRNALLSGGRGQDTPVVVNVTLDGQVDGRNLFRAVQTQARIEKRTTGRDPFAG